MFEQQVTRINHCTQISREETQHGRGAINARCKRFTSISYANMTYHPIETLESTGIGG